MSRLLFDFDDLKHSHEFLLARRSVMSTWFLLAILMSSLLLGCWVTFGTIEVVIKARAEIRTAENFSSVRNEVAGPITVSMVVPGAWVTKGQLLWKIDMTSTLADLDNSSQQLQRAKIRLAAAEKLYYAMSRGSQFVSSDDEFNTRWASFVATKKKLTIQVERAREDYQKAYSAPQGLQKPQDVKEARLQYDYESASAESWERDALYGVSADVVRLRDAFVALDTTVSQLSERVQKASVVAPITGTLVEKRRVNVGDLLLSGEEVTTIVPDQAQTDKVDIQVDQKDRAFLRSGQNFRLRLDSLPPGQFGYLLGHIIVVPSGTVQAQDGRSYFPVLGEIEIVDLKSRDGPLVHATSGMTGEARIIVRRDFVWRVLLDAMNITA